MAVSRLAKVLINLALIPNLLIASTIDQGNCLDVEDLGTNNVDRYDYSIRMDVDSACDYTLEIKMKHDDTLPIPSDANHCNPTVLPPIFASDGLPYYAMRWQYASVPRDIKAATGIDHVSIDFNPCGHPPVDVFTIPHYDLHLYLVDPDYRKCMTCETIPGAPVCNPGGQSTPSGQGKNRFTGNIMMFVFYPSICLVQYHLIVLSNVTICHSYSSFLPYQDSLMLPQSWLDQMLQSWRICLVGLNIRPVTVFP